MAGIAVAGRRLLSCVFSPAQSFQLIRHSSYKSSPFLEDIEITTKYEVTTDPNDWKYVERVLPLITVPEPVKREEYPSGWKPQSENLKNKPYFVERTKNHMIPVYLRLGQRGIRKHTIVKKIQGDIFLLEKELLEFLNKESFKPIRSQVNEFAGYIRINGDFVNATKYWVEQKQF
ncbi:hypothetical protein JTB14_030877 [Gonioctena quinquepunctata]|nr:hypothetical protein JTB14_030877 [Gonioctena quinquepunctata]